MNSIKSTIGKNIIIPLLIFVFILVLNFCNIDTLAVSFKPEHSQKKSVAAARSHSHGDSHPESTAHSPENGENSSCCSNIQVIATAPQKILLFTRLEGSSFNSDQFLLASNRNLLQLFLVWTSINGSGPPESFLSKFTFLADDPSHAPPVVYLI